MRSRRAEEFCKTPCNVRVLLEAFVFVVLVAVVAPLIENRGRVVNAEEIFVGIASSDPYIFNNTGFVSFFESTDGTQQWHRMAQYYPNWTISLLPDSAIEVQNFQLWLEGAARLGVEPLICFTYDPTVPNPAAQDYANAFQKFMTRWPDIRYYLAWNEPNHPGPQGVSAETGAQYYLAAYSLCTAAKSCYVAAGNLLEWSPNDPSSFWMKYGPDQPCAEYDCSYLDQYKYSLSAGYGHPHLRPENLRPSPFIILI
eukprot:TRINITY_DN12159_c0_g1_i1.p1 TRINITY_DN12159_c0_g1~~TRINITY_DN12159_c0_g1_i1.p1  ORF type:complete len:255 (+),score=31.33 TRINITY_DN12159_c0_g1_i1:135-899(+)